jgi:hypothetical protein
MSLKQGELSGVRNIGVGVQFITALQAGNLRGCIKLWIALPLSDF